MAELILGDCITEMKRLAERGVKVDCVIADPPYGTSPGKWDKVIPADDVWAALRPLLKKHTPVIIFGSEPMASEYRLAARDIYKYDLIWDKVIGVDFVRANHKPINCFEKMMVFSMGAVSYSSRGGYCTYNPQMVPGRPYKGRGYNRKQSAVIRQKSFKQTAADNKGVRFPKTILRFPKNAKNPYHMTQKPVNLLEWLVKTYSNEGELVLDFCMGSGSTGVACANTGRKFIGIELNNDIYKIAEKNIKGDGLLGLLYERDTSTDREAEAVLL